MVIKNGGTVHDLTRIEHAYAPPFSSAKDPVAVSGYVAGNILSGKMQPLYWRELAQADLSKVTLVDVRTADEFALGAIEGAVNIPLDDLRLRMSELPKDKPVWVYCGVGLRGYLASNILRCNGYADVSNLVGGLKTYRAATAPVPQPGENTEDAPMCAATCARAAEGDAGAVNIDACGLQCPGPIVKLKKAMEDVRPGGRLCVKATDPGFPRDAKAWCNITGNSFVSSVSAGGVYTVVIEKGGKRQTVAPQAVKGKTFIMFSDDLDKALATFVLANGAAATGEKVTIFFTFWGLNVVKKEYKPRVEKDFFGRMFGLMLPGSSRKLKLSKMNMCGIGAGMMRNLMKRKGVSSLEELRSQAIESGVEFIACQMSMDVMGVKREELLDCVTVGGVATYMERADKANVNLFI